MAELNKQPPRIFGLRKNEIENRATTFSNDPVTDRVPLIGQQAKTTTALRPTGEIQIHGRTFDAVAEGTFIEPFRQVRITGTRDFRLTVERLE
jgi:membrane-bound ClpP family serine protease